jgi:hypothetical protein
MAKMTSSSGKPRLTATLSFARALTIAQEREDRHFRLDELGTFSSSSGGAINQVDPNFKQPYSDDMSGFVERQLFANVSGRFGFVYKRLRRQFQNVETARVRSLYTITTQAYDNGPDGLKGTTDDVGTFALADIPKTDLVPSRTMLPTGELVDYQRFMRPSTIIGPRIFRFGVKLSF